MKFSVHLTYQVRAPGTDFIFMFQAARTRHQRVLREQLEINQSVHWQSYEDAATETRYLRLQAMSGPLDIHYSATVDLVHHIMQPAAIGEVPVSQLPGHVVPYLYPSRYCESDQLNNFAMTQFGHLQQGYVRVKAIRDWVSGHVAFRSNSSNGLTSALHTIDSRQGVCRDFAHLMIALCRAVNIPARFVTGIDYGADASLGPQDFHAYVEAYVGHRWYVFDPSGTAIPFGLVRMATGMDAAHAAFATIFGNVDSGAPVISIDPIADETGVLVTPQHTADAISTHGGEFTG